MRRNFVFLMIIFCCFSCGNNTNNVEREQFLKDSISNAIKTEAEIQRLKRSADSAREIESQNAKEESDAFREECKQNIARLNAAYVKLEDLKKFRIGRTESEKETQLENQFKIIEDLKAILKNCNEQGE